MSQYLQSSTLSSLGTRLSNLRRAITLGDEGDDPTDEDCSHISNALRAYYTERERPFPPWLPKDPKAPAPAAAPKRTLATSQLPPQEPKQPGRSGGLGDLWGDSAASQNQNPQTASLRRGRGGMAPPLQSSNSAPSPRSHSPAASSTNLQPAGARPLPSQRSGSAQPQNRPNLDRAGSSAGSAQERLRARLQGGRSPSPLDPSVRKPVGLPRR